MRAFVALVHSFFFYKNIYFIRISKLKFAKLKECFKNKAEAEILKRTDIILCAEKSVRKYNTILCF